MAGLRFINPYIKIVICLIGAAVMLYYLREAVVTGDYEDNMNIVRGLVFLAFVYLLGKSVMQIMQGSTEDNDG